MVAAFARRGAEVLHAPTLRIVPAADDGALVTETAAVVAARPDAVLVTTSYGLNGWLEAADSAGSGDALLEVLAGAALYVRGPKARGAVRGAGLVEAGAGERETTASLVDRLLADLPALAQRRREAGTDGPPAVAVQLHGWVDEQQLARVVDAGAVLLTVAPYRWSPPPDPAAVERLLDALVARTLDAVVFTSAPAAAALVRAAEAGGRGERLREALAGDDVLVAAVGTVTAEPLHAAGIAARWPQRHRMGALIRMVCEHLETAAVRRVDTTEGVLEVRGALALLGGRRVALSPSATALLRALVDARGAVLTRGALRSCLVDGGDEHAVEVALARLRDALGSRAVVTTVVKRGYRLST